MERPGCGLIAKHGGAAIPLEGCEIDGEVMGGVARLRLRQKYRNTETRPIEAVYTFPLPLDGTLVGFSMTCDGRRLDGQVKEREQAFRDYDDAVIDGHGAALLEQERPNVFTASVGNLLPGEETIIEIAWLQRVRADEGALRLQVPTLVAPRYIPGKPAGDRTAHGHAEPTDRVPDADRITPPIGDVAYGLALDVVFDVGEGVEVESPSHRILATRERGRVRVRFAGGETALDRDLVLVARGASDERLTTVAAHRDAAGRGTFALTVVPELAREAPSAARLDVVFVVDKSGSMAGASIEEARAALRLCLRHLREGDRFNIIAFSDSMTAFSGSPVPFTQRTLEQADAWVARLRADGGTELLAPMVAAATQARDGVVVLLTDGQVGNEAEILAAVLQARGRARVHSFGIGTNVSDALLRDLAAKTGGGVEMIFPGERIDEKVLATFARAVAPRVVDLKLTWDGLDVDEVAPTEPPALVDGEPWTILGRFAKARSGELVLSGSLDGQPWRSVVRVDLSEPTAGEALVKAWAAARIRDWETLEVTGRRADRMKERIVALAVEHGVSSKHTSFLVVETRTGDRRASGVPETRVVPVHSPAGWEMFQSRRQRAMPAMKTMLIGAPARASVMSPAAMPPPAPMARGGGGILGRAASAVGNAFGRLAGGGGGPAGAPPADDDLSLDLLEGEAAAAPAEESFRQEKREELPAKGKKRAPASLLHQQLASGLWDDPSLPGSETERQLLATARALLALRADGIDASHALHGAQVKKAVAAILALAPTVGGDRAEAAYIAAWLVAGTRSRKDIERAAATIRTDWSEADVLARIAKVMA